MDNLSILLRNQARDMGLCNKWFSEWADESAPHTLIDKFKRGLDFCIERNWPSVKFIRSNFDSALLHNNLIYIDEHINLSEAPSGIYVINGDCSGTLMFKAWAAATIYVRHTSNIKIIADDFSKICLRLYDESDAEVVAIEGSSVKLHDYR